MRKRRIFLTLLFIIVFAGIGLYFWFTRDIEAEENKIVISELQSTVEAIQSAAPDDFETETPRATVHSGTHTIEVTSEATTATDEPLSASTLQPIYYRIYTIDPNESVLDFRIESDINDIEGDFDIIGHWLIFEYDPESTLWNVTLALDIDGTSVDTGSGVYDTLIKLSFNVERYPIGRFVGEAETTVSDLDGSHELNFVGQLELRGVVQDYTVPAHINIDGDTLTGNAEAEIDVYDFGVDFPSSIASHILEANISVVATKSDEPVDQPTQVPLSSTEQPE